ncbi:MAG: hypothetical protein C6P37_14085 [Caldibacillus debilis]|uniref:Uncharacterized protein n=1 Tax=Caldibacillus debilis TaxID=301148 RepID=A0A3E0K095_9BACI|nr:hypothetical protein [Bacillaceae bacterium]OUM89129.1 MAG: hypothetical protein BAA03_13170 [Caldibacillus debilis]MBY6273339.1 hypothetical protein [Bacillaceae bacterium]REJ14069.1 MAG: hypothetical protein C6W57_14950 [Caldibacillus debilis]REJ26142.1 MAG: hypothetical protein C6P37_14085 [Caldibacillus debilis]
MKGAGTGRKPDPRPKPARMENRSANRRKFVTKPPILRFCFFKSGSISGKTVVFSDFICYFLLKR